MHTRNVAVTLVCATTDQTGADRVCAGLRAAGRRVALLEGAETDPRRAASAVDASEPALIALCESQALDGPKLRQVEGVLRARRGPQHALIRVDMSLSTSEQIAGIERAIEAMVRNRGSLARTRGGSEGVLLREVVPVHEISGLAMPVVRLAPGEELDGDTQRIELPDTPKRAELVRRRKAVRELERRHPLQTLSSASSACSTNSSSSTSSSSRLPLPRREFEIEPLTIALVVGAGLLAVLASVSLSGALG